MPELFEKGTSSDQEKQPPQNMWLGLATDSWWEIINYLSYNDITQLIVTNKTLGERVGEASKVRTNIRFESNQFKLGRFLFANPQSETINGYFKKYYNNSEVGLLVEDFYKNSNLVTITQRIKDIISPLLIKSFSRNAEKTEIIGFNTDNPLSATQLNHIDWLIRQIELLEIQLHEFVLHKLLTQQRLQSTDWPLIEKSVAVARPNIIASHISQYFLRMKHSLQNPPAQLMDAEIKLLQTIPRHEFTKIDLNNNMSLTVALILALDAGQLSFAAILKTKLLALANYDIRYAEFIIARKNLLKQLPWQMQESLYVQLINAQTLLITSSLKENIDTLSLLKIIDRIKKLDDFAAKFSVLPSFDKQPSCLIQESHQRLIIAKREKLIDQLAKEIQQVKSTKRLANLWPLFYSVCAFGFIGMIVGIILSVMLPFILPGIITLGISFFIMATSLYPFFKSLEAARLEVQNEDNNCNSLSDAEALLKKVHTIAPLQPLPILVNSDAPAGTVVPKNDPAASFKPFIAPAAHASGGNENSLSSDASFLVPAAPTSHK